MPQKLPEPLAPETLDQSGKKARVRDGLEIRAAHGQVWLIGCGPGDIELLTLKAARVIGEADVLIYDRLVGADILDLAKDDAERIYVGKEGFGPATPQEDINRLLLKHASLGQKVARLKGGDAFVFARAAEELATLQDAGIPTEVVPGITAAHACAASIQLPLTLRQHIQQLTLITGASANGDLDIDWPSLARPGHAAAIYMGVTHTPLLQKRLLLAGADKATPIVIVENGTRTNERSVATDLEHISDAVQKCGIKGPAIILIGLRWTDAGLQAPTKVERFPAHQNIETKRSIISHAGQTKTRVQSGDTANAQEQHSITNSDLRRHG